VFSGKACSKAKTSLASVLESPASSPEAVGSTLKGVILSASGTPTESEKVKQIEVLKKKTVKFEQDAVEAKANQL